MLPLLGLAAAVAVPTILETLGLVAATAAVTAVATRAASDAYDSTTKKKEDSDES